MTRTSVAVRDSVKPELAGARRAAHVAFGSVAPLFTAAVLVQVFLAGAGVFGMHSTDAAHASSFDAHRALGNALGIVAVVLLLLALLARRSHRIVLGTLVLAVLTEVAQHGLAQAGNTHRWFGALHAADGALILLLGCWLTLSSRRRVLTLSS